MDVSSIVTSVNKSLSQDLTDSQTEVLTAALQDFVVKLVDFILEVLSSNSDEDDHKSTSRLQQAGVNVHYADILVYKGLKESLVT